VNFQAPAAENSGRSATPKEKPRFDALRWVPIPVIQTFEPVNFQALAAAKITFPLSR
jgi:hypothetical protein